MTIKDFTWDSTGLSEHGNVPQELCHFPARIPHKAVVGLAAWKRGRSHVLELPVSEWGHLPAPTALWGHLDMGSSQGCLNICLF